MTYVIANRGLGVLRWDASRNTFLDDAGNPVAAATTPVVRITEAQDGYWFARPAMEFGQADRVEWILRSQGFPVDSSAQRVFRSSSESGARLALANYRKTTPVPVDRRPPPKTTTYSSTAPADEVQANLWFVDKYTGDVNRTPSASTASRMMRFANESAAVEFANSIRQKFGKPLLVAAGQRYPLVASAAAPRVMPRLIVDTPPPVPALPPGDAQVLVKEKITTAPVAPAVKVMLPVSNQVVTVPANQAVSVVQSSGQSAKSDITAIAKGEPMSKPAGVAATGEMPWLWIAGGALALMLFLRKGR